MIHEYRVAQLQSRMFVHYFPIIENVNTTKQINKLLLLCNSMCMYRNTQKNLLLTTKKSLLKNLLFYIVFRNQ